MMEVLGLATEQDMLAAFHDAEGTTRGYPNKGLFLRFPIGCMWQSVSLNEGELREVHHIRSEPTWLKIAGIGRTPAVAVEWVTNHPDDQNALIIGRYHAQFLAGQLPPPIILVGPPAPLPAQLVVLEGNKRTVAACMGKVPVDEITFLVGTSPAMENWYWYSDRPGSLP